MQRVTSGRGEFDVDALPWNDPSPLEIEPEQSAGMAEPPAPLPPPSITPSEPVRVSGERSGMRGVIGAAVLGALLPQSWFRPGTFIAAGDIAPALRGLSGITRFWTNEATGTGSTDYPSAQLLERGLVSAVRWTGGSPELAQRLWFTLVLAVCAASVAWFALAFVRRPWAVFAAGAVSVLNPYLLTTAPNPLPIIAISSSALLLGMAIRVFAGRHVPALLAVALAAWSAQLARNPPLLALFAVLAVLSLIVMMVEGPRLPALRLAFAYAVGSLFWVVPFVLHHAYGTPGIHPVVASDPNAFSFLQQHSGPANVVTLVASWAWGNPDVLGNTARLARFPWSLFRWALPAAVVLSLAFSWRRRAARAITVAIAVLVVLSVGSNPPFRPVYEFFQDLIPYYEMFRQPMAKFGALLVLCFAAAIALGVDDAQRRWERREDAPEDDQPLPVLGGLLLASVMFVYPLLLGTVIPGERTFLPSARVSLPQSWVEAGAALDALPGTGATLVLPLSDSFHRGTTWGYYGIDDLVSRVSRRPAEQLLPQGYFEPTGAAPALMREAESALANGDRATLEGAMRALGTAYLAIRTDTTTQWGTNREFRDDKVLVAAATRLGLRNVGSFEHVEVFALPPSDRFGFATREISLISDGRSDANEMMAVAATSLDTHTVIGEQGDTGTAWVPAPGNGGLAVSLPSGSYVSRVVSRGPAMWRATTRGRSVELVPADTAEVGGVSMLDDTPVTLTANRTPFAMLVANDPGNQAARLMVPLRGPTNVQLAAGASVSLLTLAPSILDLSDSPAQRCNSADGLPQGAPSVSAGLSAVTTTDGVTLTAARSSVCIAEAVRLPQPVEGHRRWVLSGSFESNQSGAARVCLWSSELAQCLPGSRVQRRDERGDFRQLIDTTADLGELTLVLAADHLVPPGDPATVVSFTGIELSPIQEADDSVTVPAPLGVAPITEVDGTKPLVIGIGNDIGNLLGPMSFEVTDCDAYDDLPAKVTAASLSGEPAPAVRLSADRHSACVAAPLTTEPGVRDIVATFEYQSSTATAARVALVDAVTGEVVASRRLPASTFWTAQQVRWTLPSNGNGGDESLRLTLYAEGPRLGAPTASATAAYRNVKVTTVTPFAFAVLPAVPPDAAAGAEVHGLDGRYVAVTATDDVIVTFQQAFASGWLLDGLPDGATAEHITANGWANAWRISGLDGRSAVLRAAYRGEGWVAYAVWSVLLVWFTMLLCTDWQRLLRRNPEANPSSADQ